jgi:hypothetical protein
MITLALPKQTARAFPRQAVLEALTQELLAVAKSEAQMRGITLPADQGSALQCMVRMDSLTIVEVLCVLDEIVGFQLKENIVRMGGYSSIEAALNDMGPKIERAWVSKQGGKK